MSTRQCRVCNEVKSLDNFKKVGKVVLRTCSKCRNKERYDKLAALPWPRVCSKCKQTLTKEQFGGHTHKSCRDCRREWKWRKKFGIDKKQYSEMLKSQSGKCAICGTEGSGSSQAHTLSVDHCHRTGTVRGLLCYRCNMGIGYLQDSPDTLKAAIEYLQNAANA